MWIQIEPVDKEIDVKTELEKLFSLEERIDYILENFEVKKILYSFKRS